MTALHAEYQAHKQQLRQHIHHLVWISRRVTSLPKSSHIKFHSNRRKTREYYEQKIPEDDQASNDVISIDKIQFDKENMMQMQIRNNLPGSFDHIDNKTPLIMAARRLDTNMRLKSCKSTSSHVKRSLNLQVNRSKMISPGAGAVGSIGMLRINLQNTLNHRSTKNDLLQKDIDDLKSGASSRLHMSRITHNNTFTLTKNSKEKKLILPVDYSKSINFSR